MILRVGGLILSAALAAGAWTAALGQGAPSAPSEVAGAVAVADSVVAITTQAAAMSAAWMDSAGADRDSRAFDLRELHAQDSLVDLATHLLAALDRVAPPEQVQGFYRALIQAATYSVYLADKARQGFRRIPDCSSADSGVRACPLLTAIGAGSAMVFAGLNRPRVVAAYVSARARLSTAMLGAGVAVPACRVCDDAMAEARKDFGRGLFDPNASDSGRALPRPLQTPP